jgi:ribulose-phosphate 3-epimerase
MNIIPAILTHTQDDFTSQIRALLPYYSRFQVDIADGKFVPNTTLQLDEIQKALKDLLDVSTIELDFHLMVKDYEAEIFRIKDITNIIKVNTVFIHAAVITPQSLQQLLDTQSDFHIGLVLNPEDSISQIAHIYRLHTLPAIQIMTIHPGFQGQQFIPETLKKIQELRDLGFDNSIYIDGGVNEHSLPIITSSEYKPDYLCIGSYLTHHLDLLKERIDNLNALS